MVYLKLISVVGLVIELIGIILLFRNDSFNLEEKKSAEKLPHPVDQYKEARDKTAKPKTIPELENDSIHRAAVRKNEPLKILNRIKTAYSFLIIGFIFQCVGVLLS